MHITFAYWGFVYFVDGTLSNLSAASFPYDHPGPELMGETSVYHDSNSVKAKDTEFQKNQNYVSQSAVDLRCRVMPPPCMKNPYLMNNSGVDIDPFGSSRSKCEGILILLLLRVILLKER